MSKITRQKMQKKIQRNKLTKPYLIGITGSLGTGKSLVGKILKKLGICVIDTDEIVRKLLSHKNKITKKIINEFGEKVSAPNGSINKRCLSSIVFKNKIKLKKLESIIHPEVNKKLESFLKLNKNKKIIAVLVPLLFECNLQRFYDETWCVVCNKKTQFKRLKNKGYKLQEALLRIKSQYPGTKKQKLANFVINNSNTPLITKKQVVKRLMSLGQLVRNRHHSFYKGHLFYLL